MTPRATSHFIVRQLASLRKVGAFPIAAMALGTTLSLSLYFVPSPTIKPAMLRTVEIPDFSVTDSAKTLLGYRISERDLTRYRAAFDAQRQHQWQKADALLSSVQDKALEGAVLADRYLDESYTSRYDELASWLRLHPDMPQAQRIQSLARRKSPVSAVVPQVVSQPKIALKGFGTHDGMHGQSMPARFKDGLRAWQMKQYGQAAQIFSAVANGKLSAWNQSTAHFWAYRAYDAAGNDRAAQQHLTMAGAHPYTLYGVLARYALSMERDTYASRMPLIEQSVASLPAVKRAAYYVALGMHGNAEEEVRLLFGRASEGAKPQLLTIASELGLSGLQMRMAQTLYPSAEKAGVAAYPVPSWVSDEELDGQGALLFAIARQESGFNAAAVNHDSGATGLMQLMPNTARYVISQYGLNAHAAKNNPTFSVARLGDPLVNMVIGHQYLHYLSEQNHIGDSLVHLLAAYNAGPGNLQQWQGTMGQIKDPLLFVEQIPFRETRHYVKQVLCNYMIYDQMMNGSSQQAAALSDGQWPRTQPSAPRYAMKLSQAAGQASN